MEEFLSGVWEFVKTLLDVPGMFYVIFFTPWRFFNSPLPDSYGGYLATCVVIAVGVLAPQMPMKPVSKEKRALLRIPEIVVKKFTSFIHKFVFKFTILYLALLYGAILYVVFLPFAYPIEWRIHFHGLVYVFSTLCIFACLVLLLDRILYTLYAEKPILEVIKETVGRFEERRLQEKKAAKADKSKKVSIGSLRSFVKSIRRNMVFSLRAADEKGEDGCALAEQDSRKSCAFQEAVLGILVVYGAVFTFAALCWLHL